MTEEIGILFLQLHMIVSKMVSRTCLLGWEALQTENLITGSNILCTALKSEVDEDLP
jgi:hypothetical protein